ncbi:helix-turn-helix transcriptional regulator [Cytobacillus sp. Sa5YUA1]|uniref:Helix-turn-helix transcriptional regulator n=1 Tax=Cytobacillus stercorigallinarum TaxID=2762240 RepID=A0ABR8QQ25_9BACI|nr:helix-turn-helix transcriptional regulator [Cytobacillus stercorigallinarum]MBD7937603.1 helix-turn-helix transcriptional regulator [Cytobacillus stercorigallinarum]
MEENKVPGFGQLILKKRKSKDWSLATLANESEKYGHRLSESYLNRLERGERTEPSINIVMVLIQALGLSLKEVFESLEMGYIYDKAIHGDTDTAFVLPHDLNKLNLVVATEKDDISMSDEQKQLIGKMIVDLYEITLHGEPSYFENKAAGYVLSLGGLLEKELYLIELEDQGFKLFFDVRVMVSKYNLLKGDIKSSLENINIKALHNTEMSIPLPIIGEYWATTRENDRIIIVDKVSETLKPYIKP